jgi:predicted P-loop ATPase
MIEVDDLLLNRDAIWAAAVLAYRAGCPNHLTREQEAQVASDNVNYQVESPWVSPVREWLASPRNAGTPITTEILLTEGIGKPVERQSRADQMEIGRILRELGLTQRRQRVNGALKRLWFRPQ